MSLSLNHTYNRRYHVQRRLDRESPGAFSEVYLADDRIDQVQVVVKESRPLSEVSRQRFERERRIEERLGGDHIVRVRGVDDFGSSHCLILEYLPGGSLAEEGTRSSLRPDQVPQIVGDVLRGLAVAHKAGVIHRDVKPGNVLLDAAGRAKLADFGSAFDPIDPPLTRPAEILGTDGWMSPQQAEREPSDPRDDIFSTGLLLYSLLSGDLPRTDQPGWRPRLDHIEERFARIVRMATAAARDDRYPSAQAMLNALEQPGIRQTQAARTAPHYLTLEDLRLLTDASRVRTLFRKLRYPVFTDDEFTPLSPDELQLHGRAAELVREGWIVADLAGSLLIVLLHMHDAHGASIGAVASQFLSRPANFLLVCTDSFERFVFVNPRRGAPGTPPRLHKLIVDRSRPTRHALDVLEGLATGTADPAAVFQKQCDAFDVERVTRAFYTKYAKLLNGARDRIRAWNPALAMSHDEHRLDAFTQRLFSRILFLYFLQKKGWLAGQQSFLTMWYHRVEREERSFFHEVLEPLFFEVLSTERPDSGSQFGTIPYLNGGLFEREYEEFVHIPNELFDAGSEEGMLGFLDDYDFTIEEDTPREVEVALDPEMLGKVFENLLEERERDSSGTFYTPRAIVHYMCRESLLLYLRRETELAEGDLRQLFEDQDAYRIGARDATRVDEALGRIRVLDPAVGSGAFLVGTLQAMVQVRRSCMLARQADVARTGATVAGWKRDFIQKSLYGVDIKPEAVEIARLRLWLSLVVDLDTQIRDVEPLPNLDYRVVSGNSLLESFAGTNGRAMDLDSDEVLSLRRSIAEQRSAYFTETDQSRKLVAREAIAAAETRFAERWLGDRLAELGREVERVLERLSGPVRGESNSAPLIRKLDERKAHYENLLRQIRQGGDRPFSYRLHFSEVFEGGNPGFDIVIANPPYTNVQRVNALEYATELDRAYGWLDDLYVHFAFRGFDLVRNGGVIGFITSDTFLTIGTKQRLRDLLLTNQLFALARCDPFEATVDTAVILARKQPAEPGGSVFFANGNGRKPDLFDDLGSAEGWTGGREMRIDGEPFTVLPGPTDPLPQYRSPLILYRHALKHAFFEPSPLNLALYERFMPEMRRLYDTWWTRIASSRAAERSRAELEAYRSSLKPGDITLLGLVTEGGQGLATADNARFLAHLEGTSQGDADDRFLASVEDRWRDRQPAVWRRYQELLQILPRYEAVDALRRSEGGARLGIGRMALYRTIPEQVTTDPVALSDDGKLNGIDGPRCWVPFRKGASKGTRWLADEPLFIRWDRETVQYFRTQSHRGAGSPRWQGSRFNFRPMVAWNSIGRDTVIRAHLYPPAVFDHRIPAMMSATEAIDTLLILGILNSPLATGICKAFLNNTNFEIGDLRSMPLVVPELNHSRRIVGLVGDALKLQGQNQAGQAERRDLSPIERAINSEILELYGIDRDLVPAGWGEGQDEDGDPTDGAAVDDEALDQ